MGDPAGGHLAGIEHQEPQGTPPRCGRDVAIRVLFVFDPWSQAVLLVAGNKAGDWSRWYRSAIPIAETMYAQWLAYERKRRDGP